MYTIGQVSEMFGLPVSTIRYYDKEGLFPGIQRSSGIRKFSEKELETLRLIECLKGSGLEIRDIGQHYLWAAPGAFSEEKRNRGAGNPGNEEDACHDRIQMLVL